MGRMLRYLVVIVVISAAAVAGYSWYQGRDST